MIDPLRSGAIFRLKSVGVIRSPNTSKSSNSNSNTPSHENTLKQASSSSLASSLKPLQQQAHASPASNDLLSQYDHNQLIKSKFDQIYRATPIPAALQGHSFTFHHTEQHLYSSTHSIPSLPQSIIDRQHPQQQHLQHYYQQQQQQQQQQCQLEVPKQQHPTPSSHSNQQDNSRADSIDRMLHVEYDDNLLVEHDNNIHDSESNGHSISSSSSSRDVSSSSSSSSSSSLLSSFEPLPTSTPTASFAPETTVTTSVKQTIIKSRRLNVQTDSLLKLTSPTKVGDSPIISTKIQVIPGVTPVGKRTSTPTSNLTKYVSAETQHKKDNSVGKKMLVSSNKRVQLSPNYLPDDIANDSTAESEPRQSNVTRSGRLSLPVARMVDVPIANGMNKKRFHQQQLPQQQQQSYDNASTTIASAASSKSDLLLENSHVGANKKQQPKQHAMIPQRGNERMSSSSSTPTSDRWDPKEMTLLYRLHSTTDARDPDFWSTIATELAKYGIDKCAAECQELWFHSLQEAQKRKVKNLTKRKNAQSSNVSIATDENNKNGNDDDNEDDQISDGVTNSNASKKRRLGKADVRRMIEASSRAEKADDLFNYCAEIELKTDKASRYGRNATANGIITSRADTINAINEITSPVKSIVTRDSTSIDSRSKTNNDWKASYVHKLSKKVHSSSLTNTSSYRNAGSVKQATAAAIGKGKKVVQGRVTGAMINGKVDLKIHRNSDSEEEDDIDDDDTE